MENGRGAALIIRQLLNSFIYLFIFIYFFSQILHLISCDYYNGIICFLIWNAFSTKIPNFTNVFLPKIFTDIHVS